MFPPISKSCSTVINMFPQISKSYSTDLEIMVISSTCKDLKITPNDFKIMWLVASVLSKSGYASK